MWKRFSLTVKTFINLLIFQFLNQICRSENGQRGSTFQRPDVPSDKFYNLEFRFSLFQIKFPTEWALIELKNQSTTSTTDAFEVCIENCLYKKIGKKCCVL